LDFFGHGSATPWLRRRNRPQEADIALPSEDYATIEANGEPFIASLISGDWAALSAHYAEDAVLYPPARDPVRGRAAIETFFASFPPVIELVPDVEKIDGSGDTAYVQGSSVVTFAPEGGGEPVHEKLKFIEIHRKQPDGRWLMVADIWNSSPSDAV
jgi:ketosteroid isomerase-like protein